MNDPFDTPADAISVSAWGDDDGSPYRTFETFEALVVAGDEKLTVNVGGVQTMAGTVRHAYVENYKFTASELAEFITTLEAAYAAVTNCPTEASLTGIIEL